MLWFIAAVMLVMISVSGLHNTHTVSAQTAIDVTAQQQALQTVMYMNALNDYLYSHPMTDGTLPDDTLPIRPPASGHHIIQAGRVYVWQTDSHGLLFQLEKASDTSALMGKVRNRRLTDVLGTDMGVSVPSDIPDGNVVYLN